MFSRVLTPTPGSLAYGAMYRLGRIVLLGIMHIGLLFVLHPSVGAEARAPQGRWTTDGTGQEGSSRAFGTPGRRVAGLAGVGVQIDTLAEASRKVVRLTNQRRETHGRRPLSSDSGLSRVACSHARDMLLRDFVGHKNPDGEGPTDRVARLHRQLIGPVAENVWARTGRGPVQEPPESLAEQIVKGWMNSSSHRRTLLDSSATHLGVCVGREDTRIRVTQVVASVQAYLEEPLPYRVGPGAAIAVSVTSTTGGGVEKYDFVKPGMDRRALGPISYDGILRVPFEEGKYRIRFYLPDHELYRAFEGIYRGYGGPEIRVVAPSAPRSTEGQFPRLDGGLHGTIPLSRLIL